MRKKIKNLDDLIMERELIHQKIELDKMKIVKEFDDFKYELTKSFISMSFNKISSFFKKK